MSWKRIQNEENTCIKMKRLIDRSLEKILVSQRNRLNSKKEESKREKKEVELQKKNYLKQMQYRGCVSRKELYKETGDFIRLLVYCVG